METLILLIQIFLGGMRPEISVIHVYGNPETCIEDAQALHKQMPLTFRFECHIIKYTRI